MDCSVVKCAMIVNTLRKKYTTFPTAFITRVTKNLIWRQKQLGKTK